ncbi:hypothetical protein R3P38DRAFT_3172681 [Favolaschia claudopus]|uniref:Uncharacterized protein n=1 Tax=Favolaschia claudopus TaxID=2862362 RepID=A0AAW0DM80_9AGAR
MSYAYAAQEEPLCPSCGLAQLTKPAICKGYYTEANVERIFQHFWIFQYQCQLHTFEKDSLCKYFRWRPDLEARPSLALSGSPAASSRLSTPSASPIKQTACISPACQVSKRPRSANAQCSWHFCRECCLGTGQHCSVSAHNSSSPARTDPSAIFAGPYGRMITPDYAMKLITKDFVRTPSPSNAVAYRHALRTTINVKLWTNDTSNAVCFSLSIPSDVFPLFHPKDFDEITTTLGYPLEMYAILSTPTHMLSNTAEEEDEWVVKRIATKVSADSTVHIRLPSVRHCLRLRDAKRANEGQSSTTASPAKKLRVTSSRELTQSLADERDVVAQSRPHSPSPSPEPYSPPPSPTPSRSPGLILNLPRVQVSEALSFPLAYACDMNALFKKYDGLTEGNASQKFKAIFGPLGLEFKSSTFSDSFRAWKYGSHELLSSAINAAYTPAGAWGPIVTAYKKSRSNN